VIGEPSFGKGTVQTMINLDQVVKNDKPQFGELKMTVAQFFRINGGTTQLRGVKPDILFPTISDSDTDNLGEASYENALPWMQIKAADYSPAGDLRHLLPALLKSHEGRVRMDKEFQFLEEDLAELKLQRRKNQVSLNEAERRKERALQEARLKSREAFKNTGTKFDGNAVGTEPEPVPKRTLQDDGLQSDERNLASELAAEKSRKAAKDVLLEEAAHIVSDEAGMLKTGNKVAARTRQGAASPVSLDSD